MNRVIKDFITTYEKLLKTIEINKSPTPADLYKLDKYWQMQATLQKELLQLGEFEIALLGQQFQDTFFDVYNSIDLPIGAEAYKTISKEGANQLINAVWVADGKSWSDRVWDNTNKLQQTLNDNLLDCVIAGSKTSHLKKLLINDFGVSYGKAERLVRTELAHIQTLSAKQRYEDYGLTYYEILGNEDDSCGHSGVDCHQMNGKIFRYAEMKVGVNAPPFHPNCKCCIIPVVQTT